MQKKDRQAMKSDIDYKNAIIGYQEELQGRKKKIKLSKENMRIIKDSYQNMFDSLQLMQEKIQEMLTMKEEALGAVFNSKLKEMIKQLEKEKREKFEFLDSLAEKETKLRQELELLKASVFVIESKNDALEKKNKKLAIDGKIKDLEIEGLKKKMFEFKKQKLRLPPLEIPRSNSTVPESVASDIRASPMLTLNPNMTEREEISSLNNQSFIYKLQKQLKVEKQNCRAAREAYTREIENKSELFRIVQECYEETKEHTAQIKMSSNKKMKDYLRQKFLDQLATRETILELINSKLRASEINN